MYTHMNESGPDRDSQMIPGAWTQSSVANPAYGTRTCTARLNSPHAEHGMTVRRLGRCRAEHRLAERLGVETGLQRQNKSGTLPSPHTHPAIDLTLAEGARGVGGQRTALVLLLQPRLHPPVSPPVSAPATAFPVPSQSFDMENSLRRGKFSHACYAGFTTED